MRLFFFIFLLTNLFIVSRVEGQQSCPNFDDFICFWDGECIPRGLVCDGKPDCSSGEDEDKGFAGCKKCPENQFHCHSEQICMDAALTCDGIEDCLDGEDETYEFAGCKKTCKRNEKAAARKKRLKCRPQCKRNKDCRDKKCKAGDPCDVKKCICDYECGISCVDISKTCPELDYFPNLLSIRYVKRDRETGVYEDAKPPYLYDTRAHHICKPGYEAVPNDVRYCYGRGNKPWTKEIKCLKICEDKDETAIKENKITCGMDCKVDGDCSAGKNCTCDGPCGRTCVNIDVECGDAPPADNAFIEYTGEAFDRVAHYICKEGYYIESGDVSRKCSGSGVYDGTLIKCSQVYCSDPWESISATGGIITNYINSSESGTYPFNTTFEFACSSNQRLLGSKTRTCMANGKWSGLLSVCDNIGSIERCPHPGVPVGGELLGSSGDENFGIDKWVQFRCYDGLVMIGDEHQKCLYIKEWSGDGAPLCVDPHFSDSASDVTSKLQNNLANIRQRRVSKAGRSINMGSNENIEVYFAIDLSISVKNYALKNTIDFAIGLINRLSANDTDDRVSYGIVVFATTAKVRLNILDDPKKTPEEVIEVLKIIHSDAQKIRRKINYGTNIQAALLLINERMLAFSYQNDEQNQIKRHIFVLTDGIFNAGGRPSEARMDIEAAYADNPPEFYSITSSARSGDSNTQQELRMIASKIENYVYVDDFYKLHTYIDQVTDVREDYSTCGQAGEVGSIRKIVSLGRVIGGTDAVERAWPWQALITKFNERVLSTFADSRVVGGGSLINSQWVLSAAHVFSEYIGADNFEMTFLVSLGILKRPRMLGQLQGSVKMFQPEKIYTHQEYNKYEGEDRVGTYQNDIALIKLGGEYTLSPDGSSLVWPNLITGYVEFTPYIRSVCLPCSPDSCVSKILSKEDSKGEKILDGDENDEERCQKEYEFLMGKNQKGRIAVVGTGFGHNATLDPNSSKIKPSVNLKQAVLNIEERDKCAEAAKLITRQKGINEFNHLFTEQMFCAIGSTEDEIIDTCKGDSGGPLVREVRDDATKESCFVQLGIVSWGYGCGNVFVNPLLNERVFYPGFYTDVTSLMSWVNETMTNHGVEDSG